MVNSNLEPTSGFEPLTRCLQNSRSGQLSYVGSTLKSLPKQGWINNYIVSSRWLAIIISHMWSPNFLKKEKYPPTMERLMRMGARPTKISGYVAAPAFAVTSPEVYAARSVDQWEAAERIDAQRRAERSVLAIPFNEADILDRAVQRYNKYHSDTPTTIGDILLQRMLDNDSAGA
jgi:hypothetical protein